MLLKKNRKKVNVNALATVVSMTTPELKEPSCPMLFAMVKQLTVAGDAIMMSIATRISLR